MLLPVVCVGNSDEKLTLDASKDRCGTNMNIHRFDKLRNHSFINLFIHSFIRRRHSFSHSRPNALSLVIRYTMRFNRPTKWAGLKSALIGADTKTNYGLCLYY